MTKVFLTIAALTLLTSAAHAQPPGGPGRSFPMPPDFHLMTALDSDQDGKISAKEIESAVAALRKLDKDKDGKLSKEEIGWPPSGFPGFGRGGGRGDQRGGGFPGFGGFGGDGGGRPQRPDPDVEESSEFDAAKPESKLQSNRFFSVDQLKRLDRNEDGKISTEEIPKRLRDLVLGRVDRNKDGSIDMDELTKLAKTEDKTKE